MTPSLPVALALLALAARDPGAREVFPSGAGPQRLDLDAAVVSASARADLGDLRLLDAAGREVPYLLVPPAAPSGAWQAGRVLPVTANKTASAFEVDLGAAREVEALRVGGLPEPFLKRFRLEGSGDRARWTALVPEGTLFALPADDLRLLEARFERGAYRYLRVTWDDRSSGRVPAPARAEAFVAPSPAATPSSAPLRVPLAVERRPSEPGVSRFALRLPGPRLPVRAVVLDVAGERVHRAAAVLEARLGPGRLGPATLGEAVLKRVVLDGARAGALRIPVARPEELELELRVLDGDNGPLGLAAAFAELEPLPWLYFEAGPEHPGPLALVAGDAGRAPPRYDLEAAREGLARARPGTARLGAATVPAPSNAGGPDPVIAPGAPIDPGAFRYAREVAAARPGLSAVRLDAAVIARTRDLADLRLAGPDGRQIAYLLEEREEPLVVALPPPASTTAPRAGTTAWTLAVPEPALPPSRLVLETTSRLFERRVRVVEERPPAEGGPRVVAEATWRHADPGHEAPLLTMALPAVAGPGLRLEVDDGDNAALPLAAPRLLLPGRRLRFLHPGPALTLLYGAPGIEAPRYDLALLAPRLRAAPAAEVALGPAQPPAAPALVRPATLAWAALVAGVLAMLGVLGRLLGRRGP